MSEGRGRALDRLIGGDGPRVRVAPGFLALCLLVTVPTILWPSLYWVFGGVEPRIYPWQLFTAVLEHGWPGVPAWLHLAGSAVLILLCGVPCERLLGSGRFLLLCLASVLANAALQALTVGVNGASLVIWAWGPPLFVALHHASHDPAAPDHRGYRRIRRVLVLMYLLVPAGMTAIPYLAGWRGNPVTALAVTNMFHLVATLVGIVLAWRWTKWIGSRMEVLAQAP